jgi:archaellum component FlaC
MTRSEYQELVEFMAPRFDELRDRLGGVETRLENVENRLENVDARLENVENRLENVDARLENVENRLENVENRLARVEVKLEENRHQIQIVAEGLTSFRAWTKREFASLREEVHERFELHASVIRDLTAQMGH